MKTRGPWEAAENYCNAPVTFTVVQHAAQYTAACIVCTVYGVSASSLQREGVLNRCWPPAYVLGWILESLQQPHCNSGGAVKWLATGTEGRPGRQLL